MYADTLYKAQLITARDFHDDGEPGSGRVVLDILESSSLENIAVFVVRKYGGVKLGMERFTLYERAVSDVLKIPPKASAPLNKAKPTHPTEVEGHLLRENSAIRTRGQPVRGRAPYRGRYNQYKRVANGHSSRESYRNQIGWTNQAKMRGRSNYNKQGIEGGSARWLIRQVASQIALSENWSFLPLQP